MYKYTMIYVKPGNHIKLASLLTLQWPKVGHEAAKQQLQGKKLTFLSVVWLSHSQFCIIIEEIACHLMLFALLLQITSGRSPWASYELGSCLAKHLVGFGNKHKICRSGLNQMPLKYTSTLTSNTVKKMPKVLSPTYQSDCRI